jgi:hypothetical protein
MRKFAYLFVAAFAVMGISLAGAGIASASVHPNLTPKCTALGGSCGDQVSQPQSVGAVPALGLAVTRAAVNQPVIGKSDLTTSATDWFWFPAVPGSTFPQNQVKVARFAPNGVQSNFCMRQTSVGSPITLGKCTGLTWQQWQFTADPASTAGAGTWTNVATGNSIAVTRQAKPVATITVPITTPTPAEDFTFFTGLTPN